MKKRITIAIAAAVLTACTEPCEPCEVRYAQESTEIEASKAGIAAYQKSDWDAMGSHYNDTAKIYLNSTDPISVATYMIFHDQSSQLYSSRRFPEEHQEYEVVKTDAGATWVNFWGRFIGTLIANGETYRMPVHINSQYVDGQIVEEHIFYDRSVVAKALWEIQNATEAGVAPGK